MSHAPTLTSLPLEVTSCSILPLLDYVSLAKLGQSCTSMRSAVSFYLQTNKNLDMTAVTRWIENEEARDVDRIFMEEILNDSIRSREYVYCDRKQVAFKFLTRNVTVTHLKKLTMTSSWPMANLNTVKKLIKQNKDMEELSIVNMKLTNSLLDVISELPKLKYLKLSPNLRENKVNHLLAILMEIKKKGCEMCCVE
eukprot:GFUD01105187.1.p1 GENE.GFUD01105187.1~~GFUD01105187.1.p1  ORF type:complete len:196 (-),score=48.28 GFUD01105187.1:100-687(-)